MLLKAVQRPTATLNRAFEEATLEDKTVGGLSLHCLKAYPGPGQAVLQQTLCVDDSHFIRLLGEPNVLIVRNTLGTFHSTKVGLDEQISFIGKPAIKGHVVTLESFDPLLSSVTLKIR